MRSLRAPGIAALALCAALAACGSGEDGGAPSEADELALFCTTKPFTPPAQSPYRLPYAVGSTYTMFQGNCPTNPRWGHHGKFAYDFEMPIGTPVYAMRAGTVIYIVDGFANDDHAQGHENSVWIVHDDGTMSDYQHFSPNTITVLVGMSVLQGDYLGLSGHSGGSDRPHLHVGAYANTQSSSKANSIPVTFSNADGMTEASGGLMQGYAYTALP